MTSRLPDPAVDLDPDSVLRVNPEVVTATFGDQVVLYHLGEGRALTLNQTAGIILQLIESRCSTGDICQLLRRAYPESAADVERDVDHTLRYLLRHGALDSPAR